MPRGIGYGPGQGGGLAGRSLARQGIPQRGVVSSQAPDDQTLSEALQMLKGGQVGAEKFLQLLALLSGSVLPQMGAGRQERPRRQGRDRQAAGGARGGGANIRQMLGGR